MVHEHASSLQDNALYKHVSLDLERTSSHLGTATVTISPQLVLPLKKHTIELYKDVVQPFGLPHTTTTYIEENYDNEINMHLKTFILEYFVIDFLVESVIENKLPIAHYPRLISMKLSSTNTLTYVFHVTLLHPIASREWKHFLFKAPKRKNYKDLDKQVNVFIKQQQDAAKGVDIERVEPGDWVAFQTTLLTPKQTAFSNDHLNTFWIKANTKTVTHPFVKLLVGKKVGDSAVTNQFLLNEYFDEEAPVTHYVKVTITSIVKGEFCHPDRLKSLFRLKSKQEVHEKLIEVFSYRNDISQRKAIIEEMFHLFFSKHRFEVPKHLIMRKQEDLLIALKKCPDYYVYKTQDDFNQYIALLAEKQIKEEILVDQLADTENIKISSSDIENYLNLFINHRLKEFVYFKPLIDNFEESIFPIHHSILKQVARREKTLNHILYHLTR